MDVGRSPITVSAFQQEQGGGGGASSETEADEAEHVKRPMLHVRDASGSSRSCSGMLVGRALLLALFCSGVVAVASLGIASHVTHTTIGEVSQALDTFSDAPSPPALDGNDGSAATGHLTPVLPPRSPPPLDAALAAAMAEEAAASTGFFADISTRLDPLNRVQLNYGVSITDVDGDHLFEAFVCGYGYANTLIAWRDGSVRDLAPEMALAAPARKAIGVASCDMDADGKEEIYVLNTDSYGGTKQFTDHIFRHAGAGVDSTPSASDAPWSDLLASPVNAASRSSFAGRSVACVDRTGNGTYDVAAASYGKPLLLYQMADATRGEIRDVARSVGFVGTTGGRGLTAGPLYPGKAYEETLGMDVFMANENGASFFFRNDGGGAFSEVAGELGVRDEHENGRGVALLDANADGRIDIAVGNWNGAHRLWLQQLRPSTEGEGGGGGGGGVLGAVFHSGGGARFVNGASNTMARPSPIRTVLAADFDNDGFQELFFNNICTCAHDMPSMCTESANRLFRTTDGRTWEQVDIGSAEERFGHGTGAAAYDMDGDGILELLISHGESKAQPLSLHRVARLTAAKQNKYLRVLPLTRGGAPARGALVMLLDSDGRTQVRVLDPGSGYLCQQEPVAHFGLGAASVDTVTIVWPGGQRRVLRSIAANQQVVVEFRP